MFFVATTALDLIRGGTEDMDGLGQISAAFSGPKNRYLIQKFFGDSDSRTTV